MNSLQQKINAILALPYKERAKPANELFNGLLLTGHSATSAKRILRNHGLSRSLIFILPQRDLPCLAENLEQMP